MNLSDNAYLKLSQRFPDIVPYVTGFYDLTEEMNKEDDSLEVGAFQIQLGADNFFIPVISKNDVIQPLDSVVKADTNLFFPALPAYIRSLINTPMEGFGNNQKIPGTAVKNPNIYSLVVPPRTGKFIYASGSRAMELLGLAPTIYKQALIEGLKEDEDFATRLHSVFDLRELAEVLAAAAKATANVAPNANTAVTILTEGTGDLSEDEIQAIIQKGYAIRGEPLMTRVAIPVQDFNQFGLYERIPVPTGSAETRVVVLRSGLSKTALFLRNHPASVAAVSPKLFQGTSSASGIVIFTDGTFARTNFVVTKGQPGKVVEGLQELLEMAPSSSMEDAPTGVQLAIISPHGELLFLGDLSNRAISGGNVFYSGYSSGVYRTQGIHVMKGIDTARRLPDGTLLVPSSYRAVVLDDKVNNDLCTSPDEAQEINQMQYWDQFKQVNVLRSNGVNEFFYNGDMISGAPLLLQRLIVEEGLAPAVAENFMKTAEEKGVCSFYMQKKADNFGDLGASQFIYPQSDVSQQFPDGEGDGAQGFIQNLKTVSSLQDPDLVNSTIIAELLQAPSLKQYAENYLPDIRLSIDRLGRILFLSRLKLSDMFTGENGIELMTTINILKGVYTSLGALYFSLQRLPDDRDNIGEATQE